MTGELETIRRLQAWQAGKTLERGEVINVHIAEDADLLMLSFLKMGGESRPWAIAVGHPGGKIKYFSVPDPRQRDQVADMVLQLADILLEHFGYREVIDDDSDQPKIYDFKQLLLPTPSHVEMLHFLAFAYARSTWNRVDIETLRAFGQLCNCLFVESQRPGQQTIITATAVLRRCFIFPTAPVRQAHLGHLLGWMGNERSRETRLAAARAAETQSVATAMDPAVERKSLQPLVEKWNEFPSEERQQLGSSTRRAIDKILRQELAHRMELTQKAVSVIRSSKRLANPGLAELVKNSRLKFSKLWWDQLLREQLDDPSQPAFWPGVDCDYHSAVAASAYHLRVASEASFHQSLMHGDREMQREELASGHGILGKIASLSVDGKRWTIIYSQPDFPKTTVGKRLCIAGARKCEFDVIELDTDQKVLVLHPRWTRPIVDYGKFGLAHNDRGWEKRQVLLVDNFPPNLTEGLAYKVSGSYPNGPDPLEMIFKQVEEIFVADAGDEI